MISILIVLLTSLAPIARGQTTITSDVWISGRMAVGASSATAHLEVQESSSSSAAFQIASVEEIPFWLVNSTGSVGVGVSPLARLDINGSADNSAVGLVLRDGSMSYPNTSSYQIAFSSGGTLNYRHAIATSHSTSAVDGSMDFYLWNTNSGGASNVGNLNVMELVVFSTTTGNMGSMRIRPVSNQVYPVQLEVSDGATPGGGTIECASEQMHSSRDVKTNIAYLGEAEQERAYEDVGSLKLAEFRYKSWDKKKKALVRDRHQPLRRGLIYEEAPASVRGPDGSIVVDDRVTNLELATKELMQRLDALKADAAKAGSKP